MTSALMWLGSALVSGGALWLLMDAAIFGLLTPTKKSPARDGDLEARQHLRRSIKLNLFLIAAGAVLFGAGLGLR